MSTKEYDDYTNSETFYAVCQLVDTVRDELRDEIHSGYKDQLEYLYNENNNLKHELSELHRVCSELQRYEAAYKALEGDRREVLALCP